jgi:hypothetical protein
MSHVKGYISAIALLAASLSCTWLIGFCSVQSAAAQTSGNSIIHLDQGRSQADRDMYYQTSQGSTALAYDIFLNLEVADSQELFRSDTNSDRFGLTTQVSMPAEFSPKAPFENSPLRCDDQPLL